MKSIILLFMLCGVVTEAEPAGATDLVPAGFNPAGDKVKIQGTETKAQVTFVIEQSLQTYKPPASLEVINGADAFRSSLKTTPP